MILYISVCLLYPFNIFMESLKTPSSTQHPQACSVGVAAAAQLEFSQLTGNLSVMTLCLIVLLKKLIMYDFICSLCWLYVFFSQGRRFSG